MELNPYDSENTSNGENTESIAKSMLFSRFQLLLISGLYTVTAGAAGPCSQYFEHKSLLISVLLAIYSLPFSVPVMLNYKLGFRGEANYIPASALCFIESLVFLKLLSIRQRSEDSE